MSNEDFMAIKKSAFITWLNNPGIDLAWIKNSHLKQLLISMFDAIPDDIDLGRENQLAPLDLFKDFSNYIGSAGKSGDPIGKYTLGQMLRCLKIPDLNQKQILSAFQEPADAKVHPKDRVLKDQMEEMIFKARGEVGFLKNLEIDIQEYSELNPDRLPSNMLSELGSTPRTLNHDTIKAFLQFDRNKEKYGDFFASCRIKEVMAHVKAENGPQDGTALVQAISDSCRHPANAALWKGVLLADNYSRDGVTFKIHQTWNQAKAQGKNTVTFVREFLGPSAYAEEKKTHPSQSNSSGWGLDLKDDVKPGSDKKSVPAAQAEVKRTGPLREQNYRVIKTAVMEECKMSASSQELEQLYQSEIKKEIKQPAAEAKGQVDYHFFNQAFKVSKERQEELDKMLAAQLQKEEYESFVKRNK